ncbi:unnamed protein product [Pleuronectes platessa]|uniref:Uncharacterized protein n=1 Tax=Pleuronectes platessa TaxID=8262 RepID=A0A9N7VZE1_PLEPL|nr:unnamed protein product [Pleuronectes platessa]
MRALIGKGGSHPTIGAESQACYSQSVSQRERVSAGGGRGAQGKCGPEAERRVQGTEPETKAPVQTQTASATGEKSSLTSSCYERDAAAGTTAVPRFPFFLVSSGGRARSLKDMKDDTPSQRCSDEDNEI